MTIHITIEGEDGSVIYEATSLSIDGAIGELGRFERHVLPKEPEMI